MKKFLVLYLSSASASEQIARMAQMSPEQSKAGMDLWMSWAKAAGSAIVDLGMPVGNASSVTKDGVKPGGSTKAAGFSIMEGESIQSITELMLNHPHHHAPGASIEILEMLPMPGM